MATGAAQLRWTALLGSISTTGPNFVTTGTSQAINIQAISKPTVYVRVKGTISQGTLVIEEADWDEQNESVYSGQWFTIATIDLTALSGTAQQIAQHLGGPGGLFGYSYIRARISSDITGTGGGAIVSLRGLQ